MTNNANQTTEFSMTYEGDALVQNTMDVKDLAPALLSLGQAFEQANSLLNGDKADITLSIRAISPGSFDIVLILNQLLQSNLLNPDWLTNALLLRQLIIGTSLEVLGLIMVIRQLKGKKPKQIETSNTMVFEVDNIKLTVPFEVAKLYNDKTSREYMEVVVRPLTRKGIDKIVFRDKNRKEIETIHSDEVEYFTPFDDEEKDVSEIIIPRQRLQLESPKFKDGKWLLNDGAGTHWYSMDDKKFLDAIEHGKMFGKYHILVCEVVLTQRIQVNGKLKMDYSIKRVIKHIMPEQQLRLNGEGS